MGWKRNKRFDEVAQEYSSAQYEPCPFGWCSPKTWNKVGWWVIGIYFVVMGLFIYHYWE